MRTNRIFNWEKTKSEDKNNIKYKDKNKTYLKLRIKVEKI